MPHITGNSGAGDDEGPYDKAPRVIIKHKLYMAMSISLTGVPDGYRSCNGGSQFLIMCRTTSQKRLAYILDSTIGHLRTFGGVHVDDYPDRAHVVPPNLIDTVYYLADHTKTGNHGWQMWIRPDWLVKRSPL